jgi:flagella basal body P-ring formation protein FlgA
VIQVVTSNETKDERGIGLNLILKMICGFGIGLAFSVIGHAEEKIEDVRVESVLRNELSKRFNDAAIHFLSGSTFPLPPEGVGVQGVRVLSETGTGTVNYSVQYSDGASALGQARFSAMVPTYVAIRRIRPGEKLELSDFQLQSVNVAQGLAYQYRGVMFNEKDSLDGIQARQTILEGQYPLRSGVEKVPDIRRGDIVRVRIVSGDISLVTMGIVQEPGYLDQSLKILTQKTKKEMVGQLKKGGLVEVAL